MPDFMFSSHRFPTMPDLQTQLRQHLDALKASGVDYLPTLPPLAFSIPEPSTEAPAADPYVSRRIALAQLAEEVSKCDRCPELFSTRTQTVFGVGPVPVELCFVGEAPGADEDRQGEPFVGAAGQLLNKIITAMGMTRDEVYIFNTLKCRPPRNATPTAVQLNNCREFFDRQLDLLQPKFLCCLGAVAAKHVLNTKVGITKLRGRVHEYRGIPVVCTYHPAYILRLTGQEERKAKGECWEDMKLLLREMGRPLPPSR
jgi:uracil-DNA glycosylase